ncbi:MAG: hypothetical protein QG597_1278, partial [Actinomycetota bacterium]|nr:hypothetical protein [Actinomycetota bacterium]
MVGADVESLERLADEMGRAARRLDDVRDRLTTSVRSATWVGAEAEAFRRSWNAHHSHVMLSAGACLRSAETELRRQAVEQADASAADAGPGAAAMAGLLAAMAVATGVGSPGHSNYTGAWTSFLASQPPPSPQEVAKRWAAMTADEQSELMREHPDLIRNLDGIPFQTRDVLNQAALREDMSRLDPASEEWQNRNRILTALQGSVPPVRQLAVYDASDSNFPPLAAVSVGDLDTATNVAVKTPGLDSTSDDIVGGTDEMALLRRETMFQT